MASGRQRYSIISDGLPTQLPDIDPDETREWVDSFDSVTRTRGRGRARYLMLRLLERARGRSINGGCFRRWTDCHLRAGPTQCELSQQEVLTRPRTLTRGWGVRGEGFGGNVSERDRAPGAG